ncbi:hypothetical protein [Rhizobium indigoferae]
MCERKNCASRTIPP